MDLVAWLALGGAVLAAIVLVALAPRMRRWNLRRQLEGGGGSLSGVAGGLDAVWRPSADEARADWEAQVEMPAPAPSPGDKGLDDGPLVIELSTDADQPRG